MALEPAVIDPALVPDHPANIEFAYEEGTPPFAPNEDQLRFSILKHTTPHVDERALKIEECNRRLLELQAHPCTSVDVEAPHTLSQMEKIVWHLRRYGKISLWDTLYKNFPYNDISCTRLGARIWELMKLGVQFEGEEKDGRFHHPMVKLPSGKMVAEYRLFFWDALGLIQSRKEGALASQRK